ncbi:uncharacterized protein MYCFIDRAFT_78976, partial [Pseudocercospora fijiensis CIRAD86]
STPSPTQHIAQRHMHAIHNLRQHDIGGRFHDMNAPRDSTPSSTTDSAIGSDIPFAQASPRSPTPGSSSYNNISSNRQAFVASDTMRSDGFDVVTATLDEWEARDAPRASNHAVEPSVPKPLDEGISQERRNGSAEHPEVIEEEAEANLEQSIAKVLEVVGTSKEDAQDLLRQSRGDVQEAVGRFYERNSPTLVEEALTEMELGKCTKTRKKFLRKGDVLIVLDCNTLGLSCRLRAEELRAASLWLAESLSSAAPTSLGPDGVNYLYTLQSPAVAGEQNLSKKELKKSVKQEDDGEAEATAKVDAQKSMEWLKAYETFFRITAHTSPKHLLLDQDSVNKSLPRIEAVSKLAHLYEANTPSSPVTSALTVVFDGFDERNMLWASIAGNAVKWLAIASNLKKASIYKEAFVHVASAFLTLPSGLEEQGLPQCVRSKVEYRAREMEYQRISVNSSLLSFTIKASGGREVPVSPSTDFLPYSVLVFYKEWIAEHLRFHESNAVQVQTNAFCNHEEQDCLQIAEFYRLLGGADDYLPEGQVFAAVTRRSSEGRRDSVRELDPDKKEEVRAILKTIKARAAEIVKPMVTSTLRWTDRDSLPYLTSLVVDEEDFPWKAEVKREESVTSEDSEEEDTDMED